jgi:hypothetical protein
MHLLANPQNVTLCILDLFILLTMIITLERKGKIVQVESGFSWKALFFGPLVPLFRGDLLWTFVYALAVLCNLMLMGYEHYIVSSKNIFEFVFVSRSSFFFVVFHFCFAIFYNRIYIKKLLKSGFIPNCKMSKQLVAAMQKNI